MAAAAWSGNEMSNRRRILTLYVVGLHLVLAVVLLRSDFIDRVRSLLGAMPPELSEYYHESVQGQLRRDGNVPPGAVVFLGDSLTEGLCVAAVASPAVNFGIGNDTTLGVRERLPRYHCLERARALVLAIGTNDLRRRSNEDILANYRAILDLVPAGTPVLMSGVLPLGLQVSARRPGHDPGRVQQLNDSLRGLATDRSGAAFCDAGPDLRDEEGYLKQEFHTGDGIHLNAAGYAVWEKALKGALSRLATPDHEESP